MRYSSHDRLTGLPALNIPRCYDVLQHTNTEILATLCDNKHRLIQQHTASADPTAYDTHCDTNRLSMNALQRERLQAPALFIETALQTNAVKPTLCCNRSDQLLLFSRFQKALVLERSNRSSRGYSQTMNLLPHTTEMMAYHT